MNLIATNNETTPEAFILTNYQDIVCSRDISEKTRERYLYDAEDFVSFVVDNGFNSKTPLLYKAHLDSVANLAMSTKRGKLRVAKMICETIWHKGITRENYSYGVKNFRVSSGHKKEGLNAEQVQKVFHYLETLPYEEKIEVTRGGTRFLKTNNTFKDRNYLITCLLAYQGLRQFEVCGLEVDDINLSAKTALVKGKHRDDKELIHLHPKTVAAIREYRNRNEINSGYLIRSRRGVKFSTNSIKHIYTDFRTGIFTQLDIDKTVHGFRHYFITTLLDKFKDTQIVMKFARLLSQETIKVYDDRLKMDGYLGDYYDTF